MTLDTHPTFRVALCDLNGQSRGKRVPGSYEGSLAKGAVRMPLSVVNLDITGADIENSPLVFETGDADGQLRPTDRGPVPVPWLSGNQMMVQMTLHNDDGTAFSSDPRHALVATLERYKSRGLRVIASTELEFTLVDDSAKKLRPIKNPLTGRRLDTCEILSMQQLDAFDPFLSALYDGAAAMGIPAQTATAEGGAGQFEITLHHQEALRAADDTWLFKSLIKGLARKFGLAATFMAKPFIDDAGNGMHIHFSVLDSDGKNIFDDGSDHGSETLRHAVAGCLSAMPASTLIFAPHANSYTRLVPGAHAPTAAAWGYENRTAAIRIPGGPPIARRIEHRVSGGDINPYLMFTAVLGAAFNGMEDAIDPPAPITGNAYENKTLPHLAKDWSGAIDAFENAPEIARLFPHALIENLVMTKRQELAKMADLAAKDHWKPYIDTA